MKVFNFNNEDEFLERFSDEIYYICDVDGKKFLCELHETDVHKFRNDGILIGECDFYLSDEKFRNEILSEEIIINIRN